jgi:hypothetical protein
LEAAKKHDYQNKKNKIDEVRILTNQMKKKKEKKLKN